MAKGFTRQKALVVGSRTKWFNVHLRKLGDFLWQRLTDAEKQKRCRKSKQIESERLTSALSKCMEPHEVDHVWSPIHIHISSQRRQDQICILPIRPFNVDWNSDSKSSKENLPGQENLRESHNMQRRLNHGRAQRRSQKTRWRYCLMCSTQTRLLHAVISDLLCYVGGKNAKNI